MAVENGTRDSSDNEVDGDVAEVGEMDYAWLQQQLAAAGMAGADDEDEGDVWVDPSGGVLTELLEACEHGDVQRLPQLLEDLSVDISTPGPDGDTALHLAALYGHVDCCKLLVEKGADANAVNEQDGSTVLHDAAAGGYADICHLVLAHAHPDIVTKADEDGDTPLHNAARGNHASIVQLLLAKGADPKTRNASGSTPAEEADEASVIAMLAIGQ